MPNLPKIDAPVIALIFVMGLFGLGIALALAVVNINLGAEVLGLCALGYLIAILVAAALLQAALNIGKKKQEGSEASVSSRHGSRAGNGGAGPESRQDGVSKGRYVENEWTDTSDEKFQSHGDDETSVKQRKRTEDD